jgi:hypothetical protein
MSTLWMISLDRFWSSSPVFWARRGGVGVKDRPKADREATEGP